MNAVAVIDRDQWLYRKLCSLKLFEYRKMLEDPHPASMSLLPMLGSEPA